MKPILLKKLVEGIAQTQLTDTITAVTTDSRTAGPGSLFVAIKGERADGHNYAAATIRAGAAAVVVEHPVADVPAERQFVVESSLDAMIALGKAYRQAFSPTVIGVTGSVGKTTTKEFCAAVFSAFGNTLKTQGNQNNELGVPNTLFRLDDSIEYAVVEMGMDGPGDLHKLSLAAQPNAAVITRIGVSHIEKLGSKENILKAKMEICDGMPQGGLLVVNGDDEYLSRAVVPRHLRKVSFGIDDRFAQVIACDITSDAQGEHFIIRDRQNGEFSAFIPAVGQHNIYNALASYTLATRQGLDAEKTVKALAGYQTTGMRQHVVQKAGMTVIEDCYNANPDSMVAGLSALTMLGKQNGGRTIAVLGDMLELGDIAQQAHQEVGHIAAKSGVSQLICCGELSRSTIKGAKEAGLQNAVFCETKQEAAALLKKGCRSGDTVLFKASRGMAFEEIFEEWYRLLEE